jgi:phage terminase large subunit
VWRESEIWVTYNTRFKHDHLHKFFVNSTPPPGSWVQKIGFWDNPFFPEVLRKQMEAQKIRDYEKYLHIWEGSLKLLAEGAIFGQQVVDCIKGKRRLYIPIQKNCEVDTFWDLGKNDETAIWFMQRVGREYRFVDYYQTRLEEVDHYTRVLKRLGYNYGKHYLPHDAAHDRLGMTKNIAQQVAAGGIRPVIIVKRTQKKNTSIMAARDVFDQCWFHDATGMDPSVISFDKALEKNTCAEGMENRALRADKGFEALSNYRYRYLDNDDVYHHEPHHDWASNGGDAFQQFGLQAPKLNISRSGGSIGATTPAHAGDY